MRRSILSLLLVLVFLGTAWADDPCWNGADYSTAAASGHEDSRVIWGTSGALGTGGTVRFCQVQVANNSASTVWAMVFDSATLPANTAVPKMEFNVATITSVSSPPTPYGMFMKNGITVACSSTEGTLTVTTASACNFRVRIAR